MADYDHYENFSTLKSINEPLLNLDYDVFINSTTKQYQPSPLRAMGIIFLFTNIYSSISYVNLSISELISTRF